MDHYRSICCKSMWTTGSICLKVLWHSTKVLFLLFGISCLRRATLTVDDGLHAVGEDLRERFGGCLLSPGQRYLEIAPTQAGHHPVTINEWLKCENIMPNSIGVVILGYQHFIGYEYVANEFSSNAAQKIHHTRVVPLRFQSVHPCWGIFMPPFIGHRHLNTDCKESL